MNEITRIHIAKTAYDIDIAAKKHLEKYIRSLEDYTNDKEVLADIEIRMTELLAERGVAAGGVVTAEDVKSIREQLGEPYEFADESGDIAVGADDTARDENEKKLYRTTDNAVLGGVLGGIATYYDVNPLWTRLAFIVLLFLSAGLAVFVYLVLWIILPPARTVTQKLQQRGKPVTVGSIRQMNELDDTTTRSSTVAPVMLRIITVSLGVLSSLMALGSFILAALIVVAILIGAQSSVLGHLDGSAVFIGGIYALVVTGVVLFGLLCSLVAYAFFARKFNKKIIISGGAIVILGLAALFTVIGGVGFQAWQTTNEVQRLTKTSTVSLPDEFKAVSSLKVAGPDNQSVSVQYIVSSDAPHYELLALPGVTAKVSVQNEAATITVTAPSKAMARYGNQSSRLTVYGPAQKTLTNAMRGGSVSYGGPAQPSLSVLNNDGMVTLTGGAIEELTVSGSGSVDVGMATVTSLVVTSSSSRSLSVQAGTIRALTVTQPEVCPSMTTSDSGNSVTVQGVTSGTMVYNGVTKSAKTYKTNCAQVVIGTDDARDVTY